MKILLVTGWQPYISVPPFSPTLNKKVPRIRAKTIWSHIQPVLTESKRCCLSCLCARSHTRKETISCYILKESGNCRHFLSGLQMQHNESFTHAHARTHTCKKTDYRYSGIKDTSLPGESLVLVLTLFNITFTCTTYGGSKRINMCVLPEGSVSR